MSSSLTASLVGVNPQSAQALDSAINNVGSSSILAQQHSFGDSFISTFTIGTVQLRNFEIPARIQNIGGRQRYAVHEFGGERRQVQTFGAQPDILTWDGILFGSDPATGALARFNALNQMRMAGASVKLTWSEFSFDGIIATLHATPESDYQIPYSIEFCVIKDNTMSSVTKAPIGTVEDAYQDTLQALTQLGTVGVQSLQIASQIEIASVMDALQQVQSLKTGTLSSLAGSTLASIVTLLGSASTAIQALLNPSELPYLDYSTLYSMKNMIGNLTTIFNTPTGLPTNTTINVVNPNLFSLASYYYGDPTQWTSLASANNLPMTPLQTGTFKSFSVPNL